jgi:hypothetical protein
MLSFLRNKRDTYPASPRPHFLVQVYEMCMGRDVRQSRQTHFLTPLLGCEMEVATAMIF